MIELIHSDFVFVSLYKFVSFQYEYSGKWYFENALQNIAFLKVFLWIDTISITKFLLINFMFCLVFTSVHHINLFNFVGFWHTIIPRSLDGVFFIH